MFYHFNNSCPSRRNACQEQGSKGACWSLGFQAAVALPGDAFWNHCDMEYELSSFNGLFLASSFAPDDYTCKLCGIVLQCWSFVYQFVVFLIPSVHRCMHYMCSYFLMPKLVFAGVLHEQDTIRQREAAPPVGIEASSFSPSGMLQRIDEKDRSGDMHTQHLGGPQYGGFSANGATRRKKNRLAYCPSRRIEDKRFSFVFEKT